MNETGIKGKTKYCGSHGLLWEEIKKFALKIDGSFDVLVIELDEAHQKRLQELIKFQE